MLLLLFITISGFAQQTEKQVLWYNQPAVYWLEALPLGNGSLGAMVFGGTDTERIQFNESSLVTGTTEKVGSYQPFGNIYLKWNHKDISNYKRSLTLNSGLHKESYLANAITFTKECFISRPDKIMLMEISADKQKSISVEIMLEDVRQQATLIKSNTLSFSGSLENNMRYSAFLEVKQNGGTTIYTDSSVIVKNANSLTLYLAAGTNFKPFSVYDFLGAEPSPKLIDHLNAVALKTNDKIKQDHIADFSKLFNKVALNLGTASNKPTNERLTDYSNGIADPALEALVFQYGRYLLISSSRSGGLPANLQGIWNNDVKPAWYSQFTTNINVQMNYWPAEVTNLSSLHQPFLNWIENMGNLNRNTTDTALKTNVGWVTYSTNNIMGGPSKWRLHRPGSAWMAHHFWEHYQFTGDMVFLKQRAYPLLKELTKYWESHLVKNKDGKLISPDGWSPEHGPGKQENDNNSYPGASYDQQIVGQLFHNYIEAAKILGIDEQYRVKVESLSKDLLGPTIGKWGQLQEWMEDVDDSTDHHRHSSHLFAVYPGTQISPLKTPDLALAATKSLDARGNESTGWSTAWRINIRARLLDGNKAHQLIGKMIRFTDPDTKAVQKSGLYSNLFDAHPPFQIDGNFGFTSGVAEMLLQSQNDEIHLLPALPTAWASGEIRGLKARGNLQVDIRWKNGRLEQAGLTASKSGTYKIRYLSQLKTVNLIAKRKLFLFSNGQSIK